MKRRARGSGLARIHVHLARHGLRQVQADMRGVHRRVTGATGTRRRQAPQVASKYGSAREAHGGGTPGTGGHAVCAFTPGSMAVTWGVSHGGFSVGRPAIVVRPRVLPAVHGELEELGVELLLLCEGRRRARHMCPSPWLSCTHTAGGAAEQLRSGASTS